MWQQVAGWFRSLFGGGGPVQIGKGNQALTGTTSGPNSPVITAGRDVHLHGQPSRANDRPRDEFGELETLMPDLLGELQEDLASHPLVRDMIVLDTKSIVYNWPDPHFKFSADMHPQIWQQVAVLQGHGLLRETKQRFAHRITEQLAQYLRGRPERS